MDASISMRFSRSADTYRQGDSLHESVAAALMSGLPWPSSDDTRTILEAGCGTGVLTARLRRQYPAARITALDVADGMARCVAARMRDDPAFSAVTADVRAFSAPQPFDLVASSSALHWMTPLSDTAARLARLGRAGGHLRVALMIDGTLGELHEARRRLLPAVTPADRLPLAAEVEAAFKGSGWRLERVFEQAFRTSHPSAGAFLRLIHAQGLTGGGVSHGRRLLTRGELARLTEAYGQTYRDPAGGVYATYSVLFVAATR